MMWGCGLFLAVLGKEMMYKPLFVRNEVPSAPGKFSMEIYCMRCIVSSKVGNIHCLTKEEQSVWGI
jgi:hypothetical protein